MNRTEAKELLPVITAFANGEQIEFRIADEGWRLISELTFDPAFSGYSKYRIAPKPKTCERWCFVIFYKDGSSLVVSRASENIAQELLADCRKNRPNDVFSSIVRVEFVEEKTA